MKKKHEEKKEEKPEKEMVSEPKALDPKLTWVHIIVSLGKPLWDADSRKWRVLNGYQSILGNQQNQMFFEVTFTDTPYWENFMEKNLYFNIPTEKENIKDDGNKGSNEKGKQTKTKNEK